MKGLCKAVTEEAFKYFLSLSIYFISQPRLPHPPLPVSPPIPSIHPAFTHQYPPLLSPSRKGKVSHMYQ